MDESDRANSTSVGIKNALKIASLVSIFVLAGAGCNNVQTSELLEKIQQPAKPVTDLVEAPVADLAELKQGIRDWCGSYDSAKKFFPTLSWDVFDQAINLKKEQGWSDLGICVRTPLLGYSEYGNQYFGSEHRSASMIVYFKMGWVSAEAKAKIKDFISAVPREKIKSEQVMLLGYWDTKNKNIEFSQPIATGWVGEYSGFPALYLEAAKLQYIVKGDTVYSVENSPLKSSEDPYPDSNVIASFDPITNKTSACLAVISTCK